MSLVMWLGLCDERQSILTFLPPGYQKLKKSESLASLPTDVTRSLSYISQQICLLIACFYYIRCSSVMSLLCYIYSFTAYSLSDTHVSSNLQFVVFIAIRTGYSCFSDPFWRPVSLDNSTVDAAVPLVCYSMIYLVCDIVDKQKYQLRAYVYQARAIIGSDSSGLSDPFAVITFAGQALKTKVTTMSCSNICTPPPRILLLQNLAENCPC